MVRRGVEVLGAGVTLAGICGWMFDLGLSVAGAGVDMSARSRPKGVAV